MECNGRGLKFYTAQRSVRNGACVEVAWHTGTVDTDGVYSDPECLLVHVRDSKDKEGRVIDITRARWSELVAQAQVAWELDRKVMLDPKEWFGDFAEVFYPFEIEAFWDGVVKGEFDLDLQNPTT